MRSLILLLLVGCSGGLMAQSDPTLKKYYEQVRAAFQEKKAFETVAYVEKRWRLPGNTGFNESIYYVENILKQAGYVQEQVAKAGDRLTYRLEKRPMRRKTWEPVDAVVTIVGETEPLLSFQTNRNMLAINSASTPAAGIEAPVVYLTKTSGDAVTKLDLKGKIVFAEQPVGQVDRLVAGRGAVGVMGYSVPAYTQPEKHPHSIQFSSIAQVDSSQQQGFGILLSTQARSRLKKALEKGPVSLHVTIVARTYQAEELTLVADIRGSEQADKRFVFSAHVQEPGANDNASGVGTLAEMARVAAALYQNKSVVPQRSISFLWGDEINSTRRYIMEDSIRAKGIQWGMSLDMVGEDTEKTGGTFLIEKMPDPSAVWTRGDEKHTEWGGTALPESAIVPHYFNDFMLSRCLDQAATNGWVVKTNPFEGGSDHTPFLQAKIPGLLLWHFTDVFYHTDADRIDKVSAWEMKNVGVSALVAAYSLTANNEQLVQYLIDEYRQSAFKRLDVEAALSRAAIASGGNRDTERHILEVWGKFYVDALASMHDISVKGSVPEQSIAKAQAAVKEQLSKLWAGL
ncbi:MAG: M28 family peptidase [Chitinophagaceae bacterium]|nr:M28 family peptidase [Chitinophagaceae bacterium]